MKETGHAAFPAGEGNVEVWWLRARCGAVHQASREVFLIGFLGPQLRNMRFSGFRDQNFGKL